MANALLQAGRIDEAVERLEDLMKQFSDEKFIGKFWQSLSLAYKAKKSWSLAEQYASRAREWAVKQGDLLLHSDSLGLLGVIARRRGNLDAAESLHHKRLALAERLQDLRGQRNSRSQLAHICEEKEDVEGAIKQHREALELSLKIGDLYGEAGDLINLGCAHLNKAEPELATPCFDKARVICEVTGHELRGAIADENLMNALFQTCDNADAVIAAKRAGVVYQKHDARRLQRLKDTFDLWGEQLVKVGETIAWPL